MVNASTVAGAYASSGFYVFPTDKPETSGVNLMKAQAMGAIPITSRHPNSSLPEVCAGFDLGPLVPRGAVAIQSDPSWLAKWSAALLDAALTPPEDLAAHRLAMVSTARARFDWRTVVEAWDTEFLRACERETSLRWGARRRQTSDDQPRRGGRQARASRARSVIPEAAPPSVRRRPRLAAAVQLWRCTQASRAQACRLPRHIEWNRPRRPRCLLLATGAHETANVAAVAAVAAVESETALTETNLAFAALALAAPTIAAVALALTALTPSPPSLSPPSPSLPSPSPPSPSPPSPSPHRPRRDRSQHLPALPPTLPRRSVAASIPVPSAQRSRMRGAAAGATLSPSPRTSTALLRVGRVDATAMARPRRASLRARAPTRLATSRRRLHAS